MRRLSVTEEREIWREVEEEFPDDRVMQEVHFARLRRLREVGNLPLAERIHAYLRHAEHVPR